MLGAFLIFPTLLALQPIISGKLRQATKGALYLGLFVPAILLSFSRAAWGQVVYISLIMLALTFITTRRPSHRLRIVLLSLTGVVVLAAFIAALLSIDIVADLFKQRASLEQSYDLGAQGRFARYCARRRPRARQADRHRAAAIRHVFPRGHAQLVPERLHVGRLARRRVLSDAGRADAGVRLSRGVRPHALAADHHHGVRRPISASRPKASSSTPTTGGTPSC